MTDIYACNTYTTTEALVNTNTDHNGSWAHTLQSDIRNNWRGETNLGRSYTGQESMGMQIRRDNRDAAVHHRTPKQATTGSMHEKIVHIHTQ